MIVAVSVVDGAIDVVVMVEVVVETVSGVEVANENCHFLMPLLQSRRTHTSDRRGLLLGANGRGRPLSVLQGPLCRPHLRVAKCRIAWRMFMGFMGREGCTRQGQEEQEATNERLHLATRCYVCRMKESRKQFPC